MIFTGVVLNHVHKKDTKIKHNNLFPVNETTTCVFMCDLALLLLMMILCALLKNARVMIMMKIMTLFGRFFAVDSYIIILLMVIYRLL